MTKYTVITGDVIQSRKYNNISKKLKNNLKEINYPDNMVIPFSISRGDEIQAVFRGSLVFPNLIREIRYKLNNIDIRFGIGFGEINEENFEINSWNMNGSAFHNARESLEEIEKDNKFKTIFKSGYKIDEAINTLLFLIDSFQAEWTDAQWEAIYYYEKEGTYQNAAEKLNIAFQNVEKRCKAAKWKEVELAEKTINNLIGDFILVEGE